MAEKIKIEKWESPGYMRGAKRANIKASSWIPDWFVGFGKDESCQFEGTWWDMICFARNVLASPNTKQCAPEFYHPEFENGNYCGEEIPYEYVGGMIDMDEYIGRDAAIAALTEFLYDQTVSKYLSLDDCLLARDAIERAIKVLESLPSADVESVKRGRWLPQILNGTRIWECSECKTIGTPQWKRCPVCEAKMDEEMNT